MRGTAKVRHSGAKALGFAAWPPPPASLGATERERKLARGVSHSMYLADIFRESSCTGRSRSASGPGSALSRATQKSQRRPRWRPAKPLGSGRLGQDETCAAGDHGGKREANTRADGLVNEKAPEQNGEHGLEVQEQRRTDRTRVLRPHARQMGAKTAPTRGDDGEQRGNVAAA
jgi:hypothetical protein